MWTPILLEARPSTPRPLLPPRAGASLCSVPSHQLAIAVPTIWSQFSYLCLINSPSILKYHLKTYVSPTHTPLSISSLLLFISSSDFLQLWKNSSDSLQKTALQRAVTACDMKDCNLSGLKHLIWVVSICSSILSPWNDGKHKKEYAPGNEGISNIKITSNAADHFQAAGAALLRCAGSQPRSSPKVAVLNIFLST